MQTWVSFGRTKVANSCMISTSSSSKCSGWPSYETYQLMHAHRKMNCWMDGKKQPHFFKDSKSFVLHLRVNGYSSLALRANLVDHLYDTNDMRIVFGHDRNSQDAPRTIAWYWMIKRNHELLMGRRSLKLSRICRLQWLKQLFFLRLHALVWRKCHFCSNSGCRKILCSHESSRLPLSFATLLLLLKVWSFFVWMKEKSASRDGENAGKWYCKHFRQRLATSPCLRPTHALYILDYKSRIWSSELPQLLHASISDALKACTYSKTGAATSVQMSRGKLDSLTPLPRCGIVRIVQFAWNTLIPQFPQFPFPKFSSLSPHLLLTAVLVRVQLHQQLPQHTATFSQVFLLFLSWTPSANRKSIQKKTAH